ncbi:hypothetical protein ABIE78_001367 [Sinorhizobium fredii]|jgi:hypothetical protein
MKENMEPEVWGWYRQFVRDRDDHTTPNLFVPHGEAEIQDFEREFGDALPPVYLAFLRQIGTGRLTADINGGDTLDFENSFLSTSSIAEILRRNPVEWRIDPDFIDDDEVPFFSLGNNSVLGFRRGHGTAVYYPFGKSAYARNFNQFLARLMTDCTFYRQLFRLPLLAPRK